MRMFFRFQLVLGFGFQLIFFDFFLCTNVHVHILKFLVVSKHQKIQTKCEKGKEQKTY